MALRFNSPTIADWPENPAEMWVKDQTKLALGLTVPKYERVSI